MFKPLFPIHSDFLSLESRQIKTMSINGPAVVDNVPSPSPIKKQKYTVQTLTKLIYLIYSHIKQVRSHTLHPF